ncbi:MAG: 4-hydroxythreonine-4-phosphate dehydrogenase PdxA [Nitrospinota bacterium]|jgi:4-hydroxythreonine-4-phosphate dehydrogenase|nr:4-hydroxythreonine-4-phosphate dehydrogenase PdxA [Nitrospinota bacterium]
MTARKPSSEPLTIALTPGDPAGIGPEIVLRAASDPALARVCELIILGNRRILERAARTLNGPPARGVRDRLTGLHVQEAGRSGGRKFEWGDLSAAAGRFSYECVEAGVRLVRSGRADALVTAPISKRAWELAGIPHPGHTEALAELTGAEEFAMTFFAGKLRVALVTAHLPVRRVAPAIRRRAVGRTIRVLDRWLRQGEGRRRPRIAVTGLNPHAGEGGRLGAEEEKEIAPAIADARGEGILAEGPFPADALFARKAGGWDGVVTMYHDQGLIAAKLLGRGRAVNVTLGLPLIRTSPDHGTAFDIAGQGKADPRGLIEAVRLAARLAKRARAQSEG